MGLPDQKSLVGLAYRDAWQLAGGARFEKTPAGLESVLHNLGFSEGDAVETPADARDLLALAGAYEPNAIYVQELRDVFGRGSFLFPIQVYREPQEKPGLLDRFRKKHPVLYKGLVAATVIGTMGLAALGGFGAKPASAYHEPQHDYDRLSDSVLTLQNHINQSASDSAVSQAELNVLGSDVVNLRPSLQAAVNTPSADGWETLNGTLREIYENMSKLETRPGGVPTAIEEDLEKVRALENLGHSFANLNYSLYDVGMMPLGPGIESWPAFAIASNQTKVGLEFNKLGWWAYAMYLKYKEVLATQKTQRTEINVFEDFASEDSINPNGNWRFTTVSPGNYYVAPGNFSNNFLELRSGDSQGWASAESKFDAMLSEGPIYVEAQLQSILVNPRARPILALYYNWDNQILVERGLRNDENFNGQAQTFEVVNNSEYGYMVGAGAVDLRDYWHTIEIRASKNHAQLGVDGSWGWNHTNPALIASDKPLRVKFSIYGESSYPDQMLLIQSVKFSGFKKTEYPITTIGGISALGPAPDAVALKYYLQNLSRTIDFFEQWISNPSLRASQQGKFWSETANVFRNSAGEELRDFRIAIDRRDPNMPYEEPDITPPSVVAINVPLEVYQFESVRINLNANDGGPEGKAGIDRILLTVKGPGGLEEQILAKPGSFAFFNNTSKVGTYTIKALAFDKSNNTSQLKLASFEVLGDTIPPALHGRIMERSYEVGTKIVGIVNATDDGPESLKGIERIEIKIERPDGLEDVIFADKNGSFEYVPDQLGTYRYKFTAFDKSGNQGPTLGDFFDTWEDRTPPEITNVTFKRELRVGEKQQVNVTALDDLFGVSEVTVNITDQNRVTQYSATHGSAEPEKTYLFDDFVPVTAGNYTIKVTAKDERNNTKELTYKFKVLPGLPNDTIPPQIRIISKPENIYANTPFRIVFEVTDDSDEFWGEVAFHDESAVRGGKIVRSPATGLTAQIYTVTGAIEDKGRLGLELRAFDADNYVTETLWYDVRDAPEAKTTALGTPPWWPLLLLAGGAGAGGFAAWRFLRKPRTPPMTPEQQRLLQPTFAQAPLPMPQPLRAVPMPAPIPMPAQQIPRAGIEELLYITNDGRPLNYKTGGMPKDAEVISGMFTAVASFVKDSGWEGALDELKLGGRRIIIERGRNSFLAAYVGGHDEKFIRPILKRGIVDLESAFHIGTWDGDKNKAVAATNPYLDAILRAAPQTGQPADYAPQDRIIIKPIRSKTPEVPPGKIQFTKEELLALRSAIPTLIDVQKRLAGLEAKLATANAQERKQIEDEIRKTRLLLGKSSEGEIESKDSE